MQADRRLIQHVKNAAQIRAELRSQPDSLRFAAAQRFGRTPKREITESDLLHEKQSLLNFGNKPGGNRLMRSAKFQLSSILRAASLGRKIRELIDRVTLHAHVPRHGIQTRAVTTRTFARFPFVDPFGLALGGELGFQNRFTVIGCALFADPGPKFRRIRRILHKRRAVN